MDTYKEVWCWKSFVRFSVTAASLFLLASVDRVGCECPEMPHLITESDRCKAQLDPIIIQTLSGDLTARTALCRDHQKSVNCIQKLKTACLRQREHIETLNLDLKALHAGLGSLCQDKSQFNKYLKYAQCYSKWQSKTSKCFQKFDTELAAQLAGPTNNQEDSICSICIRLIHCADGVIRTACDNEGATIYKRLVRYTKLPMLVYRQCEHEFRQNGTFEDLLSTTTLGPFNSATSLSSAVTYLTSVIVSALFAELDQLPCQ